MLVYGAEIEIKINVNYGFYATIDIHCKLGLIVFPRRLFCFGSLVVLDVVFC